MEEVEAGLLEGRIRWLAETILENLDTDKLDEWIRRVGLAADNEKLRAEIERVDGVVAAVKGRAIGNRSLARSLGRLREVLYDTDDGIDELDYYRLQQQVEGGVTTRFEAEDTVGDGAEDEDDIPMDNTDVPAAAAAGSSSKKRSKAWEHFTTVEFTADGKASKARCKYCDKDLCCTSKNGTSALRNHLKVCKRKRVTSTDQPVNPSSAGDGAPNGISIAADNSVHRKRRRTNEQSTQNVPAKPWNKADFSNRIQQFTCHLQEAMNEILRLHGSDSFASSNLYHSTSSYSHLLTSGLTRRRLHGRVAEKKFVINLLTEDDSDSVTVVSIVGIGGIGKTALAQHIYNDPIVERQFQHRIWICVSNNFDEIRLTREMLDFVCQEKHDGLCSFAKLQESLMSNIKSKRFLIILDDVWDDMNIFRWNKLLAPLKSNNAKGNMILVTTRSLSVAKRIGTIELIKLGALDKKDFWPLFTACAFGEEKYKAHKCLSTIAQKIADKLKGIPLAAETAGELLRRNRNVDHWNNILKNEDWKSLQLSGGIMSSLKLSYDQLPSLLQRCFQYCSIFPIDYCFVGAELVLIWTSQGLLKCSHSNKRLEEIGQEYLTDLVTLGFFELVERKKSTLGDQTCYAMCGLMHDFARIISRTDEYTDIEDDLQCSKIVPTVRHLTIVTDSEYHTDPYNEKYEKIINNAAPSLTNLRTLVLIVKCAFSFSESIKVIVQKAQKLRLLQVCSTYTDSSEQTYNHFDPLLCNMVNPIHIRYIKIDDKALPQSLSKFYHLQVLDAGSKPYLIMPNDMENLVSLRHLVAPEQVYTSIASISRMTALQEIHGLNVRVASSSEMTLLQSMNQLVQFGVSQLENITSGAEACGARLRDKQSLETLRLFWSPCSPQDKCENARDVLEGLQPHKNLKHLQISWYNGATSPSWFATSLTSLQTLHLQWCGQWQILPSLDGLPFLRKMELRSMQNVVEIPIPPLEELILFEMPKLERCSCTSIRDLNCSLRVLKIRRCPVLKVFPLFEDCQKFEIEQKSWLSHLSKLIIHDCPHLHVHNPLPPSTVVISKLSISGVSTLGSMKGLSDGTLTIQDYQLTTLDDKVLSFHNLRFLTSLVIYGFRNSVSISFEGLRKLVCLKSLEIRNFPELIFSNVPSELSCEDMTSANRSALPSLECLNIDGCRITGRKWLRLMLEHALALKELTLCCKQIRELSVGEEENSQPNAMSATEAPSSLNFAGFTSLEKLDIRGCPELLSSLAHNDGNGELANGRWLLPQSLIELDIKHDYHYISKNDSLETLEPCFPGNLTSMKKLEVSGIPSLTSLQLQYCTALKDLTIEYCRSLSALEGLQFLHALRHLEVYRCPSLPPYLGSLSGQGYDLCQRLERLKIDDPSILTTSFYKHLTSLQRLELNHCGSEVARLTDEQERALLLLMSLQELQFWSCCNLIDLPTGLHSLPSLKRLEILYCNSIRRLPEKGLPPSLEELDISNCSEKLVQRSRSLASKLKVKIDGGYVN